MKRFLVWKWMQQHQQYPPRRRAMHQSTGNRHPTRCVAPLNLINQQALGGGLRRASRKAGSRSTSQSYPGAHSVATMQYPFVPARGRTRRRTFRKRYPRPYLPVSSRSRARRPQRRYGHPLSEQGLLFRRAQQRKNRGMLPSMTYIEQHGLPSSSSSVFSTRVTSRASFQNSRPVLKRVIGRPTTNVWLANGHPPANALFKKIPITVVEDFHQSTSRIKKRLKD